MRDLFVLLMHLLTSVAKLLGPGGARADVAETLVIKHQLLIINRTRRRAPNLTALDRIVLGLCTLFMNPGRIRKMAATLKPATLLSFHQALKTRKYRRLFSSQAKGKPGPEGPSRALIEAIVEMKRRNPRYGCPRIARKRSSNAVLRVAPSEYCAAAYVGAIISGVRFHGSSVSMSARQVAAGRRAST